MSRIIEIIDSDDDNHDNGAAADVNLTPGVNTELNNDSNLQRRRPRKSALQANLAEVQFETIAVEDDETSSNPSNPNDEASLAKPDNSHRSRVSKTAPKILAPKPLTNAELYSHALEDYVTKPNTKECIAAIAHERMRINYLLSMFGMPDISFSLYTKPELLKFQFEERLKQQKMMQNWTTNRTQNENR